MRQLLSLIIIFSTIYISTAQTETGQDPILHIDAKPYASKYLRLGYFYGRQTFLADSLKLDAQGKGQFNLGDHPEIYLIMPPQAEPVELLSDGTSGIRLTLFEDSDYRIDGNSVTKGYDEYYRLLLRDKVSSEDMDKMRDRLLSQHEGDLLGNFLKSLEKPEIPSPEIPEYVHNRDSFRLKFSLQYYQDHYLDPLVLSDPGLIYTPVLEDRVIRYFSGICNQEPLELTGKVDAFFKREMHSETRKFLTEKLLRHYSLNMHKPLEEYVYLHIVKNYYLTGMTGWSTDKQLKQFAGSYSRRHPASLLQVAPNLELPDQRGNLQTLNDNKSSYTLIIFWDYSCDYCRKALEDIVKVWKNYNKSDIQIFTVFTGENLNIWKAYLDQKLPAGWTNTYLTASSGVLAEYNVEKLPSMFLLNDRRVIVDKNFTVDEFETFLKSLEGIKK